MQKEVENNKNETKTAPNAECGFFDENSSKGKNGDLANFIKYCLGYIKITRERTTLAQQKFSVNLSKDFFELVNLLNGDTDEKTGELINLKTFYKYDPNEVPEDEFDEYQKEKELANKIDNIYSKHRNDQYTKQVILNFGYFEIEIPVENNSDVITEEEQDEVENSVKTKVDRYPLFSLPVKINKQIKGSVGEYSIHFADPEVQVNIGILEPILGESLYFGLLEEMGKYEIEERLTLPIVDVEVFKDIWHKIKAQLRLKNANFDEKSFSLEEMKVSLTPKANYFLAEDLNKLSKFTEEELEKTALISWSQDDELNIESGIPSENVLYFPFLYDKYQLSTLSILGNKGAIIQGPPGTGKSETISNIICHLAATGNKVLFVSQKAQALKVVKDKLKKLNIEYLFGYLPNPSSAQIGEEDEADGIAPQLSALESYIGKLEYKFNARRRSAEYKENGLNPAVNCVDIGERENIKNAFNDTIAIQRKIYQLNQELLQLNGFDLNISDFACFKKSFSSYEWEQIKDMKEEMAVLEKEIEKYKENENKKRLDLIFSSLKLEDKNYSEIIDKIRDDVKKTGFDRYSGLLRRINNFSRNFRLSSIRKELPREIVDHIDKVLADGLSRNEQIKKFDCLYDYCLYYENLQNLEKCESELYKKLSFCGISDEEFEVLDNKIDSASVVGLEELKNKIVRTQEIKSELHFLKKSGNLNSINSQIRDADKERIVRVASYIKNIIDRGIIKKWKEGVTIKQIVTKLSKAFGKSKKAFKTFDNLRKDENNFNAILDLIPVWIMELDDASRIIPLEAGIFDYVILDEASQCNVAYTLPVMFRSKKALFVGDSEQMRDNTIIFKSNNIFDQLAHTYGIPEDKQIKATGSAVQSVLDIAKNRGFMSRTLHYHYRSPKELINFSNEYFYKPNGKELIPINNNYLTYQDTNRIMLVHKVESDWEEEISDDVNIAEAKGILNLFKDLRNDDYYSDKSIGILSFFNAQAAYIRDLFEQEGFKEEDDNYKVSIIEGIQGDEKDIVIYSFVIRNPEQKNRYIPLTGQGGNIRADINKGRVNVAFSRARLQVHCFVSMPISKIPEGIWIKKYLEYVQENGGIDFYSLELNPFDSYFEEEFFNLARARLEKGYKIQNQVKSCGFKIDFTVTNTRTGKCIAIECDGPCHFKDEIDEAYGIYIESDEERQRVLEAAGWKFYRIKYADWIDEKFDRSSVAQDVIDLLR